MAGRPQKKGLSYKSISTHKYDDFEMVDLLERYGPLGATIYDVITDMVLRQGYYLEIPMNQLALSVQKTIGSKWIKNRDLVLQVVQYCADIGLFDKDLSLQSVITSVELQRIYALATVRNKVQIEKYRLIEQESNKPLLSAPQNSISVSQNSISVTEIQNNNAEMRQERKGKGNIYISIFENQELERTFQLYIISRKHNGYTLSDEQIHLLREQLLSLSTDEKEQIAIVKKATMNNWKSFYPLPKAKKSQSDREKKNQTRNKFNDFEGHDYDIVELEKALLDRSSMKEVT